MASPVAPKVLFIDGEERLLHYVADNLEPLGYDVLTSRSWDEAKELLDASASVPSIIFVEPISKTNTANGSLLSEIRDRVNGVPVVVLSSARDSFKIVEAIQQGARDYVCKPFNVKELVKLIETTLSEESEIGSTIAAKQAPAVDFMCCNPKMEHIRFIAEQIQDTKVPVLLTGESGVGKDVIARLIYQKSVLADKQFIKVPCAAIPTELIESELFGHKKGAFTGAHIDRAGKFEIAHGGTIFLDEIGEMSAAVQAKFLHVLQEGTFSRLGSNDEVWADVRVIAATNRDLETAIAEGSFREDLYYRLNVVHIDVPPLRKRPEEIRMLSDFFLKKYCKQYGRPDTELTYELKQLFDEYHWPGNVRELENLIKRYIVLNDEDSVRKVLEAKTAEERINGVQASVDDYLENHDGETWDLKEIKKQAVSVVEHKMIERALRKTGWNKWKAAKELKVSYKTLLVKIEEYGIKPRMRA